MALLHYPTGGSAIRTVALLDGPWCHCHTLLMGFQFTPEQEIRLEQIASVEGIAPERLV
jgi:hypothetical protein